MDWITATGELAYLRTEFPGWGIFHGPDLRYWYAVRGRWEPVIAETPRDLRWRLLGGSLTRGAA